MEVFGIAIAWRDITTCVDDFHSKDSALDSSGLRFIAPERIIGALYFDAFTLRTVFLAEP